MLEQSSLFVDGIRCVVFTGEESFVEVGADRGREICLDLVERQYGFESPLWQATMPCTGQGLRSVSLLREAIRWSGGHADSQLILLAQSYPDLQSLASPLQQIIELEGIKAETTLGLTHLEGTGAIEGLRVMDWMLEETKLGLLLATEVLPFAHQRRPAAAPPRGSAATCLVARRGAGALRIGEPRSLALGSLSPDDLESSLKQLAERENVRHLIAQASLLSRLPHAPFFYRRTRFEGLDYQSSDVWLSLATLMKTETMEAGDKIALVAYDGISGASACVVEWRASPRLELVEWLG